MSFLPCKSRVMLTLALGLICLIFMSSTPLYAAGGRCVIKGRVTSHALGEAMSDALVKITNQTTGKSAYKRTDVNGDYLFPRFQLEGTDNKLEVRVTMPRYNSSFTYINTASAGETITHDIELIDKSRPIQYGVSDKAKYTKSQDTLYATWKPASDPQSGIVDYLAAVGTAKHQADVKDWHSIGNVTEITFDNLNLQENTTYYIGIQAVNGDGLQSKARWSNGVTVDTIKPEVNITNPLDNSAVSGIVQIEASATDETAGIKKVRFYIDNVLMYKDDSNPYGYSWDTTQYPNNSHTVKAIAIDNVGYEESAQVTVTSYNAIFTGNSIVTVDGYKLVVQKRKQDGTLDPAEDYITKGVAWSPASAGNDGSASARRAEFSTGVDTDAQFIKDMNANTVRTYLDFGTNADALEILDKLYQDGIMVIMGVDNDGRGDIDNALAVVDKYKNHPAILMWMIGNEWNINCYGTVNPAVRQPTAAELNAAAQKTQDMANQIKAADPNHLVCSGYGDLAYPALATTQNYVQNVCTSVDVWGINVYRGPTFGTTFTEWESISAKPMFISEFGTDSYKADEFGRYPITGHEDEQMQADFDISLWADLFHNLSAKDPSKVCAGGVVFAWCDEWWKVPVANGGSPNAQDNGGYYTTWDEGAFPDGCGNEEYFGIVKINRVVKKAYTALKDGFDPDYDPTITIELKAVSKGTKPGTTQWDTYARFYKDSSIPFYDKPGDGGYRGINIAVLDNVTGVKEDTKVFDTYTNTANATAMVNYLNGIANNKLLMFAIADEGITSLTEAAKQTLESLGSTRIRSVGIRESWAMVTKKGAGSAYAEDGGSDEKTATATIELDAP